MVLIRQLGEIITSRTRRKGNTKLRVEVDVIEGRGDYWKSRLVGGTELIVPD